MSLTIVHEGARGGGQLRAALSVTTAQRMTTKDHYEDVVRIHFDAGRTTQPWSVPCYLTNTSFIKFRLKPES